MTTTSCGTRFSKLLDRFVGRARDQMRAFSADSGGNVAMIFAVAIIPIFGLVGAAIDYGRANAVKASMQAALDATALMLAQEAGQLSAGQLAARTTELFLTQFRRPEARNVRVQPRYEKGNGAFSLTLSGSATVEAAFVRVIGVSQLNVSTASQVVWGTKQLELALVLDNTGSMAESGKIDALKRASHDMLKSLRAASAASNNVKVSIVPFDTHVNIGPTSRPWIDWSMLEDDQTNVRVASLSGGARSVRDNWTGCVIDRSQPYDARNTSPTADPATFYPAVNCNLATIQPLTADWRTLDNKVDAMKASGNTDLTIGLAWGWTMLTPDAPLSAAVETKPNLEKVIVFLTDGKNTENRWSHNSDDIDRRTQQVCRNIKAANIKMYTIRVIEGNAALLRDCATKPEMYFEVRRSSEISDAFAAITRDLSNFRIAR
jgi:Flp pilus assembly protein TadG